MATMKKQTTSSKKSTSTFGEKPQKITTAFGLKRHIEYMQIPQTELYACKVEYEFDPTLIKQISLHETLPALPSTQSILTKKEFNRLLANDVSIKAENIVLTSEKSRNAQRKKGDDANEAKKTQAIFDQLQSGKSKPSDLYRYDDNHDIYTNVLTKTVLAQPIYIDITSFTDAEFDLKTFKTELSAVASLYGINMDIGKEQPIAHWMGAKGSNGVAVTVHLTDEQYTEWHKKSVKTKTMIHDALATFLKTQLSTSKLTKKVSTRKAVANDTSNAYDDPIEVDELIGILER